MLAPLTQLKAHVSHDVTKSLKAKQLAQPTTLLRPLAVDKSNAQYFFDGSVVALVTTALHRLGLHNVLCIGMPSIHEALVAEGASNSMLLDLDDRFEAFFPSSYAKFNMFNGHFFSENYAQAAQDFCSQVNAIVIDPPFGGIIEALAVTIKQMWVTVLASRAEPPKHALCEAAEMPTLLFFPYFMEVTHLTEFMSRSVDSLKEKVLECMPSMRMTDYQVDYANHPTYKVSQTLLICVEV